MNTESFDFRFDFFVAVGKANGRGALNMVLIQNQCTAADRPAVRAARNKIVRKNGKWVRERKELERAEFERLAREA